MSKLMLERLNAPAELSCLGLEPELGSPGWKGGEAGRTVVATVSHHTGPLQAPEH